MTTIKRRARHLPRSVAAFTLIAMAVAAAPLGAQDDPPNYNQGYEGMLDAFRSVTAGDGRLDPAIQEALGVQPREDGRAFTSFTGQEAVYMPSFNMMVESGSAFVFNPHPFAVFGDLNGDGSPEGGAPLVTDSTGMITEADRESAANVLIDNGWLPSEDGSTWEYTIRPLDVWVDGTPVHELDAIVTHAIALPDTVVTDATVSVPTDLMLDEVVLDLETGNIIPPTFPGGPIVLPPGATPADYTRSLWNRGGGAIANQNGMTTFADGATLFEERGAPLGPNPIVVIGIDIDGPMDLFGGAVSEQVKFELVDDRGALTPFTAQAQFNNDYGDAATNIKSFTWSPGSGVESLYDLIFDGSNFTPQPASSAFLWGPSGGAHILGANELDGATGFDAIIFVTDPSNPVRPETVRKSNLRGSPSANPSLIGLEKITPVISIPDGPGTAIPHGPFFNEIAFSEGDCTDRFPSGFEQTNEIRFFPAPGGFLIHQVDQAGQTVGGHWSGQGEIALTGFNNGHLESYVFDPGTESTNDISGTYGFISEPIFNADGTVTGEACSWTTSRTSVEELTTFTSQMISSPPTPEPTEDPPDPTATPVNTGGDGGSEPLTDDGSSDGLPVWLGVLGVLAGLGLIGWGAAKFLGWPFGPTPADCQDELKAWLKAIDGCVRARKIEAEKQDALIEAQADLTTAERTLDEHCKAYPPACGPSGSASSDGRTVTRDDLYVQRQWGRAQWAKYKAGTATAQQTSDAWGQPPDSGFDATARANLVAAKAKTPGLEKTVTTARTARDTAKTAAEAARAAAKLACDAEATARAAYENCIGSAAAVGARAASAVDDPPADGGGTTGSTGGGPAIASDEAAPKDCEAERRAAAAARSACDKAGEAERAALRSLLEAVAESNRLGERLGDLLAENPSLSDPEFDDSWIQEAGDRSTRITSADLWAGEQWRQSVWDQYVADDLSAVDVQNAWRQGPPAGWNNDVIETLAADRDRYNLLMEQLGQARERQQRAEADHEIARAAAADACTIAEAAQKAYLDCIGAQVADAGARMWAGATATANDVSGHTKWASFVEESGLDIEIDPIDYREGDEITTARKLNGLNKYANVTLKWGVTDSVELADWHQLIADPLQEP